MSAYLATEQLSESTVRKPGGGGGGAGAWGGLEPGGAGAWGGGGSLVGWEHGGREPGGAEAWGCGS